MIRDEIESVETTSPSILDEQTEQLKLIFPQAFSEGKIDFTKLRAALGDMVDTQPERYSFTWAGKRNATLILQTPSYATLTPAEDESVDFDITQNLFIEGDNLEVLKLLYKSYSGRVKMIYIDPPYNTGSDFVYPDNFADPLDAYLKFTGQKDAGGNLLTSKVEISGRFHSSWLSMMYPRLYLARQLLRDDGAIFVSIDDTESHNLRMLLNEIFGEENFVANIIWQKKFSPQNDARYFSDNHDHILLYSRQKEMWRRNLLPISTAVEERYSNLDNDPRGPWSSGDMSVKTYSAANDYPVVTPSGRVVHPPESRCWMFSKQKLDELIKDNRIWFGREGSNVPRLKQFRSEVQQGIVPLTIWLYKEVGHNQEAKQELKKILDDVGTVFDTPKPVRLIKRMLQIATSPNSHDIVMDFFAGSCSTAQAVLELNREDDGNRQFVMVQLPEPIDNKQFPNLASLGAERIRRVSAQMRREGQRRLDLTTRGTPEDLGFRVFKEAPSNYKQWQSVDASDPEVYTRQIEMFADPLVENWNPVNVLWEVAVKEGYGLNAQLKKLEEVRENTVWRITDTDKDQTMLVCLDNEIQPSVLSALPLSRDQVFVCRNKALDDTKVANLALQCRLKKI